MRLAVISRLAALAVIAGAMAACAQNPHDVRVNVGTGYIKTKKDKATDFAALYLSYARMATVAYTDDDYLQKEDRPYCPDRKSIHDAIKKGVAKADALRATLKHVEMLEREGWRCTFGNTRPLPCQPPRSGCYGIAGLQYHAWRRLRGGGCTEVAIAFRGTDIDQIGDWVSNVRWFNRLLPLRDQYDQVADNIEGITHRVRMEGCRNAQVVSVGHSLGGGLAQYAAFNDESIRYVYAFDPSPVTAFLAVARDEREKMRKHLGIDRVNETGEILVGLRFVAGGFVNPQACNPFVRMVRFNITSWEGMISQHNMNQLTERFENIAPTDLHEREKLARGVRAVSVAQNCVWAPEIWLDREPGRTF